MIADFLAIYVAIGLVFLVFEYDEFEREFSDASLWMWICVVGLFMLVWPFLMWLKWQDGE